MSKNTFFKKKVSFLVLANFHWNLYFIVFPGLPCLVQKRILAKTDSVHDNAFFSLPDTNSVSDFAKNPIFWFFTFLDDHLKKKPIL